MAPHFKKQIGQPARIRQVVGDASILDTLQRGQIRASTKVLARASYCNYADRLVLSRLADVLGTFVGDRKPSQSSCSVRLRSIGKPGLPLAQSVEDGSPKSVWSGSEGEALASCFGRHMWAASACSRVHSENVVMTVAKQ